MTVRLELLDRRRFADGQLFGDTGSYERLTGRAEYTLDPRAPAQQSIFDIEHAPVDPDGLVRFAGDWSLLRPVDLDRGNRRILFDWGNRGNKRALPFFNDAAPGNDPMTADDAGNGFLMRRGYSVLWGAWQGDLLPGDGRMLLDLPVVPGVEGLVRVEFIGRPGVRSIPLSGWATTRSHPTVSRDTTKAQLTRRRYPGDPRIPIPSGEWSFAREESGVGLDNQGMERALVASDTHLHIPAGFQPGWIYELVYTGREPLVLGLGYAAVRELVRHTRQELAAERIYAWGRSQTGRAIRDFLYRGFNDDGTGARVFDGVIPHVAGAGRFSLARFSIMTASAGQQFEDHESPSDRFPFAYAKSTDHLTGRTDAILKRPETDPKVMHTQSASEYWQRRGSLAHTDTQGRDLAQPDTVRIYAWASSQHSADPRLGKPVKSAAQSVLNVVATSMLFRAMLDALDRWATDGTPPPPSRHPTVADGTLVPLEQWRALFPAIPGIATPRAANELPLLDFGPELGHGRITREPPARVENAAYAVLLPSVDADGNEVAGIRAPMVAAPLATYTGWNIRARGYGHGGLYEFTGSTIPFPDTQEERAATGDPRRSVLERYSTPDAYVAAITIAAEALVADGFMLEEDVARCVDAARDWGRPRHEVLL